MGRREEQERKKRSRDKSISLAEVSEERVDNNSSYRAAFQPSKQGRYSTAQSQSDKETFDELSRIYKKRGKDAARDAVYKLVSKQRIQEAQREIAATGTIGDRMAKLHKRGLPGSSPRHGKTGSQDSPKKRVTWGPDEVRVLPSRDVPVVAAAQQGDSSTWDSVLSFLCDAGSTLSELICILFS